MNWFAPHDTYFLAAMLVKIATGIASANFNKNVFMSIFYGWSKLAMAYHNIVRRHPADQAYFANRFMLAVGVAFADMAIKQLSILMTAPLTMESARKYLDYGVLRDLELLYVKMRDIEKRKSENPSTDTDELRKTLYSFYMRLQDVPKDLFKSFNPRCLSMAAYCMTTYLPLLSAAVREVPIKELDPNDETLLSVPDFFWITWSESLQRFADESDMSIRLLTIQMLDEVASIDLSYLDTHVDELLSSAQ